MPEISRFFGIVIAMYHDEHPPAHFHVRYGSDRGLIEIENLNLNRGKLSPRVRGLVLEWALQHRAELRDNWKRAQAGSPLVRIQPLE
jgi:hypothetical protein